MMRIRYNFRGSRIRYGISYHPPGKYLSTQMSALLRQEVLEEYNKELLSFTQEREAKAAPQLFRTKFPGDTAQLISQLEALQKTKSTNSSNGSFLWKGKSQRTGHQKSYMASNYIFMASGQDTGLQEGQKSSK